MSHRSGPLRLLSAAEMRAAEAATIAAGVSGAELMQRAGAGLVEAIERRWTRRPISVLCGPGNNGGDGLVAASLLRARGWPVRLALLGRADALKGDAALMAQRWGGPVEPYTDVLDGAELIVDALFGTGLSRDVEGEAAEMIRAAFMTQAPLVSVDIPSGIDSDTGLERGAAAYAQLTVTFGAMKPGHALYPGRAYCGELEIVDIGVDSPDTALFVNDPLLWKGLYPVPDWDAHKYRRGHAAIVSGPRLKTGAARLAARAALRAGAGLVTVFSPRDAADENAAQLTAVMVREVDGAAAIASALSDKRFTVALLGPGAGVGEETARSVLAILASGARAVLDADALTSFAEAREPLFVKLRPDDVLTPHAGEFARLFPGIEPSVLGKAAATRMAAARAGAVVLLKGADTVIAAPDGRAAVNMNAPPWLATAGSGDVLAGIIAGLAAQGMPGFEAACASVWLHGAAAQTLGRGLIAEEIEQALPGATARI